MKLSESQRARVRRLLGSNSTSFVELARAADLDPGTAFREADLRRINFGDDDLSGFDFTGANLRGANLSQARGLERLILDGALTDEATRGFIIRDFLGAPEMVLIPPGIIDVIAGDLLLPPAIHSYLNEVRSRYTGPIHQEPVFIGRYPVTQAEFDLFISETGYTSLESSADFVTQRFQRSRDPLPGSRKGWPETGFAPSGRHPVVCVSYEDAEEYAAWASRRSRKAYFLPDRGVWEYCARAGANTRFHWGNEVEKLCTYANVADRSLLQASSEHAADIAAFRCDDGFPYLSPIGSFRPNAFGLYDTLGNVREWCSTKVNSLLMLPPERVVGENVSGQSSAEMRFLLGGSWASAPGRIGLGYFEAAGSHLRDNTVGFRVCRRP